MIPYAAPVAAQEHIEPLMPAVPDDGVDIETRYHAGIFRSCELKADSLIF